MREKPGFCARNLVALVAFSKLAYDGLSTWDSQLTGYDATLFAFDESGWVLCKRMAGFQCFDILISCSVSSLRKAEHVGHHILAAGCAVCCLSGPLFTHYASYYFGVVEISSVPLCLVDIYRAVPKLAESSRLHSGLNELMRTVFALSFIWLRFLYLMSVAVALSLLQQYWGYKVSCQSNHDTKALSSSPSVVLEQVLRALFKMVLGDASGRDKED
ncbi:MAG: hypothetical protein SGPRY_013658 [Prymnesium sp.]